MRAIDGDALIVAIEQMMTHQIDADDICEMIQNFQTIEPEPKKGKWIYGEDEYGVDGYHCNVCGFFVPWDYVHKFINYIEDYNFCPHCGADMRGDQNG